MEGNWVAEQGEASVSINSSIISLIFIESKCNKYETSQD